MSVGLCFMSYKKKDLLKRIVSNIDKNILKRFMIDMLELSVVALILTKMWQGVELLLYNEIRPSVFHSIIAIPMVFYLRFICKKIIKKYFCKNKSKNR